MAGKALLLPMMDIDPEFEEAFNRWYDERYLLLLRTMPGFLSGRRYRAIEGQPKYLAAYELADLSALESPEYVHTRAWDAHAAPEDRAMFARMRNLTRGVYEHLLTLPDPEPTDLSAARALLLVGLEVPPEHDEEFNAWYNTEHLPLLAGVPGVIRARRYRLASGPAGSVGPKGDPTTYVALYDLERPEVQASAEWARRRETPWSARILKRLVTRVRRNLYERIGPAD